MRIAALTAMALLGVALAGCASPSGPDRSIPVEVKRYQYSPGTNQSLNLTLGETAILELTSADVTHGFAITEYGIQKEVPPGQKVEVRITASKAGDFTIYCTVFCGTGHPQHKGTLHVA